jgi:four helix bundle suffix protein
MAKSTSSFKYTDGNIRKIVLFYLIADSNEALTILCHVVYAALGLKLVGVARASLEELLLDYQDFLRQRKLPLWQKHHPQAQAIRKLAYASNRSYKTYRTYIESASPATAANTLICLVHQTNFLLDQQLRQLEKQFLDRGGFTEKLYHARQRARRQF